MTRINGKDAVLSVPDLQKERGIWGRWGQRPYQEADLNSLLTVFVGVSSPQACTANCPSNVTHFLHSRPRVKQTYEGKNLLGLKVREPH